MARRYSGHVTVTVVWSDTLSAYKCGVRDADHGLSWRDTVRSPQTLDAAVDSSEAYDATARTALSFAEDDKPGITARAWSDDNGWHVSRVCEL